MDCSVCAVRDSAACASLRPDERAALARLGHHRVYERGETVFAAGDPQDVCATLTQGLLKVSHHDEQGHERILSLVHPSGFVGELFSPLIRHDVIALARSTVCVFAWADYEAAIEQHPALARALLRRAAEDLYTARAQIALDGRRSAAARVAGLLLSLSHAASPSPCHGAVQFDLPVNRGELATLLGLTIETVSRQFGRLERDGLLRRHGTRGVELLDTARLEQLAA
ncbi:Crp/Fnr family transcriptional regulator [Erythrobacteraceae bacterium CFH 75059]|nr:Crp/Fnr family transcriptional regulator [Erythrobacteraceae bacterium CFH 75059]